jgi:hypothetical protein
MLTLRQMVITVHWISAWRCDLLLYILKPNCKFPNQIIIAVYLYIMTAVCIDTSHNQRNLSTPTPCNNPNHNTPQDAEDIFRISASLIRTLTTPPTPYAGTIFPILAKQLTT